MEEVGVHGEGRLGPPLHLDRDAVLLGVVQQALSGPEVPLPPRGDDPDVGPQGVGPQLEPNLVVALARGSVTDGIGPGRVCDFDQPLGDQWPGDRRAQQVFALVQGVGPEHREHEVPDELLPEVLDIDLGHAHSLGLGPCRFKFLALTQIGGEGHDLAVVLLLQPSEDDRGVQAA